MADDVFNGSIRHQFEQNKVITGHAEKSQPHNQHAGDGPPFECDVQRLLNAAFCRLGGPDVGPYRNKHADEAGEPGEEGADGETDGGLWPQRFRQDEEDYENNRSHQGDDGVLTLHVGAGPLLNSRGNLLHLLVPLGEPQDPLGRDQTVGHCGRGTGQGEINRVLFHVIPPFKCAFGKAKITTGKKYSHARGSVKGRNSYWKTRRLSTVNTSLWSTFPPGAFVFPVYPLRRRAVPIALDRNRRLH